MGVSKYPSRTARPWVADFPVLGTVQGQRVTKRQRRFFRTKSEAEACCAERERQYQLDRQKPVLDVPNLQHAAQAYLDHHFVRKSPNYKHNEAQRLEYWLAVLGPTRELTTIQPMEIERVLVRLLEVNRAHTTVAKYRANFEGFWKHCLKRRWITSNLFDEVMEVKPRAKRKIRALTETECQQLLAHMSPPAQRCFLLLLHLGLRAGELFGDVRKGRRPMCGKDVDWDHDAVHIFSNEEDGETKGHEDRWLPLDDVTRPIFQEVGGGPVCGDAEYWWFRDQIEKAAQRAGLGHATIHQLRHTFASLNLANGVPESVVQAWLGHKDSAITKRYTHLNRVLNHEYRGKITLGENCLAPVPTLYRHSEGAKNVIPFHSRHLHKSNLALPTGIEPVFEP